MSTLWLYYLPCDNPAVLTASLCYGSHRTWIGYNRLRLANSEETAVTSNRPFGFLRNAKGVTFEPKQGS